MLREGREYRRVKQTGGRGQYAHMKLRIEPTEPGTGFHSEDKITGGRISREHLNAIERVILDATAEGVYAGVPMADMLTMTTVNPDTGKRATGSECCPCPGKTARCNCDVSPRSAPSPGRGA